jgi:hypothetical protein
MGFKEVFKANIALLQVSPITFIAGALLVLIPPYILFSLTMTYTYRKTFPSSENLVTSLEHIPEPRYITFTPQPDIMGVFLSWLLTILLTALVANIISEGSLRRQVDYAIAYTSSPTKSLLAVSLSLLTLMLPQLIAVGVGFAFIHYSVLGWDLGRTVTIGLYVTLAIMVLGLLVSSLVSYIRAPPIYWAVVIVMVIAMYVVFLARPNTMRLIIPLMGLLEYMEGGGLENLLEPLALYLVSTAILYLLISYRR